MRPTSTVNRLGTKTIGRARIRRLAVSVAAAALVTALGAGAGLAMTIKEAVQVAVDSHPTVLAAKSGQAAFGREIDEAYARYLPNVDTRVGVGYDDFTNNTTRFRRTRGTNSAGVRTFHQDASITLNQLLFDGFETPNLVDAARFREAVAGHQVTDAEENIALDAIEFFFEVHRSREILKLARDNVDAHRAVFENVRLLVESGAANSADLQQAQSRLSLAQARLVEQEGLLRNAEANFLQAIGVMPDDLEIGEAPTTAVPATLEDAVARAAAQNPAILAAGTAVLSRRAEARAAEGPFVPRLDVEVRGSGENNVNGTRGDGHSVQALLVMRYNWYSGGRDTARLRGAQHRAAQQLMRERETRRQIDEQIRLDWARYQTAKGREPELEVRVDAAQQVVSAYRQQFELGQRTLLDVLDVENELFQARSELVSVQTDVHFSQYAILHTLGAVRATLGVSSATPEEVQTPEDVPLLLLGK